MAALADSQLRRASISVSAPVLSAAGVGVWFGEGQRPLPGPPEFVVATFVALVAPAVAGSGLAQRVLVALVALLAFGGSWIAGSHEASAAFNDCVVRCEEIRDQLERYRSKSGTYPDFLSELGGSLPGDRILRGSLLHYSRHGTGYKVEFSDWLAMHTATDSQPCSAHK